MDIEKFSTMENGNTCQWNFDQCNCIDITYILILKRFKEENIILFIIQNVKKNDGTNFRLTLNVATNNGIIEWKFMKIITAMELQCSQIRYLDL